MTNGNKAAMPSATLDAATVRAVRGRAARLALVQAVRDGGLVTTETDWIEWKSQTNLADPRSRMNHVIRHILGFANRDPGRSAQVSEGCAYLLLGVEPGAVSGVRHIDPATLDEWTRPYLGSEVRWDADYVELDSKEVLVITVEAPRWGDPLYPLRKAFDRYENGTIFVRRPGKTERASSAEIDQLSARVARGAQVLEVSLDWWSDPKAITPVEIRQEDTEAWAEAERRRVLPSDEQLDYLADQTSPFSQVSTGEHRSILTYKLEVEEYLDLAVRTRPSQIHRAAVRKGLGAVDLAIKNSTMHNFPAVEMQLRFRPTVFPYFYEDDAIPEQHIPRPPRPYGTSARLLSHDQALRSSFRPAGSSYVEKATRTIHFAPIDVRPGGHHRLDRVHLIVGPEMAGKRLVGEWSATSTGVSGRVTGTLTVQVGNTPVSWGDRDWYVFGEDE